MHDLQLIQKQGTSANICWDFLGKFSESKDWGLKKLTTFAFGHFTNISGHYIANYVNIFHKSVVLMVILRG